MLFRPRRDYPTRTGAGDIHCSGLNTVSIKGLQNSPFSLTKKKSNWGKKNTTGLIEILSGKLSK